MSDTGTLRDIDNNIPCGLDPAFVRQRDVDLPAMRQHQWDEMARTGAAGWSANNHYLSPVPQSADVQEMIESMREARAMLDRITGMTGAAPSDMDRLTAVLDSLGIPHTMTGGVVGNAAGFTVRVGYASFSGDGSYQLVHE